MKSRAAICVGPGLPLEIDEIDVAGPAAGEVLVEIKATGLCHTDYHMIDGSLAPYPYPVILGHEGAGVVVEVGAGVTSVAPGDHVLPLSMPECGQCVNCLSGKTNFCLEFYSMFGTATPFSWKGKPAAQFVGCGTFANYTNVKEIAVVKIRADAPFQTACCIACGVVTGVGSATHGAKVESGSSVIVFGLGGVGLNVLQGARLAGARQIVGVDINPGREATAREFGLTDFVNPKNVDGDLVAYLTELTRGGADYTFECVGNTVLMRQAIESARAGTGTAMVIGGAPTGQDLSFPPMSILMGRTFKGALLGNVKSRSEMPGFVDLYMQGRIKVDELITHYLPLEQINEGFALMKSGQAIRSVVVF